MGKNFWIFRFEMVHFCVKVTDAAAYIIIGVLGGELQWKDWLQTGQFLGHNFGEEGGWIRKTTPWLRPCLSQLQLDIRHFSGFARTLVTGTSSDCFFSRRTEQTFAKLTTGARLSAGAPNSTGTRRPLQHRRFIFRQLSRTSPWTASDDLWLA